MPSLTVEPGTGVKLSGQFTYSGTATGKYRVDFFQIGSDGRPMILHAMTLDKPGPWELEVPKGLGKVNLLAFVDAEGNGPQLAEPSALKKDVDVEQDAIPALDLALVDGAPNEFATDSPTMLNPVAPPPQPTPPGAPADGSAPAAGAPPADGSAPPAPPVGDNPPGGAPATPGGPTTPPGAAAPADPNAAPQPPG